MNTMPYSILLVSLITFAPLAYAQEPIISDSVQAVMNQAEQMEAFNDALSGTVSGLLEDYYESGAGIPTAVHQDYALKNENGCYTVYPGTSTQQDIDFNAAWQSEKLRLEAQHDGQLTLTEYEAARVQFAEVYGYPMPYEECGATEVPVVAIPSAATDFVATVEQVAEEVQTTDRVSEAEQIFGNAAENVTEQLESMVSEMATATDASESEFSDQNVEQSKDGIFTRIVRAPIVFINMIMSWF